MLGRSDLKRVWRQRKECQHSLCKCNSDQPLDVPLLCSGGLMRRDVDEGGTGGVGNQNKETHIPSIESDLDQLEQTRFPSTNNSKQAVRANWLTLTLTEPLKSVHSRCLHARGDSQ